MNTNEELKKRSWPPVLRKASAMPAQTDENATDRNGGEPPRRLALLRRPQWQPHDEQPGHRVDDHQDRRRQDRGPGQTGDGDSQQTDGHEGQVGLFVLGQELGDQAKREAGGDQHRNDHHQR